MTDDFELMRQGICPVCRIPVGSKKHRKKSKLNICLNILRQRHGIKPTVVEVDGKHYEVSARPATDEEVRAARESKT